MKLFKSSVYAVYKKTNAKLLAFASVLLINSCGEHELPLDDSLEQSHTFAKWALAPDENRPNPINGPSLYAHKQSKAGGKTVDTFMWCSAARVQIQIHLFNGQFSSTTIYNPKEEKWVTGFYIPLINNENMHYPPVLAVQDISKKHIYNLQANNTVGMPKIQFATADWLLELQFSDRQNLQIHLGNVSSKISKLCGSR
jgi:hypothetical protein